jgi:hypothetical protein
MSIAESAMSIADSAILNEYFVFFAEPAMSIAGSAILKGPAKVCL